MPAIFEVGPVKGEAGSSVGSLLLVVATGDAGNVAG